MQKEEIKSILHSNIISTTNAYGGCDIEGISSASEEIASENAYQAIKLFIPNLGFNNAQKLVEELEVMMSDGRFKY